MDEKVWSYRGPEVTSVIPAFRDGAFRERHSGFRIEVSNWGWSFGPDGLYSTLERPWLTGPSGCSGGGCVPGSAR